MNQRVNAVALLLVVICTIAVTLSLLPASATHVCVSASATVTTPTPIGKYVETCSPVPMPPPFNSPFSIAHCEQALGVRVCATASAHLP